MDSGVDVGLGGATVLVGVGLGVAFGVDVGTESKVALPAMVTTTTSPSVIRSAK